MRQGESQLSHARVYRVRTDVAILNREPDSGKLERPHRQIEPRVSSAGNRPRKKCLIMSSTPIQHSGETWLSIQTAFIIDIFDVNLDFNQSYRVSDTFFVKQVALFIICMFAVQARNSWGPLDSSRNGSATGAIQPDTCEAENRNRDPFRLERPRIALVCV